MRDSWGSTGIPNEDTSLPLFPRIRSLVAQDVALAEAKRQSGFSARQAAWGFRQPVKFIRPPEVNVGALMDLGS